MSITATCGACGRNFIAPAQFEGKRVKCKGCGEIFVVTVAPSLSELEHETDDHSALSQLAAASQTKPSPLAGGNPFDRSDDDEEQPEDENAEASAAGLTPNVLTFNYAGASDVDRWLPITLIIIGFLMLLVSGGNQDSKAAGWISFTRFLTPTLLYGVFTFPITLAMLKKAADEQRFALPPSPAVRCFASYMPAFVLITWMQMAGDGLTIMQLFAGVFGVALSSAILWLLFRLREEHIGTTVAYGAGGFAIGIAVTIALTLGLNKVGQEVVVSEHAQASVPVSPFGEGLAWVPQLPAPLAPAIEKPVPPPPTVAAKPTVATFSPGTTTIGEFLSTAIPSGIDDVISPCSSSPFTGVIRARPGGVSIEAWNVLTGEQKPGTLQLPGRPTGNIVMSTDGDRLAWIAQFPRLAVQIWSFTAGSVVSSVDLDRSKGNAELVAFISSDLLLIDHTAVVKSSDSVASATPENSPAAAATPPPSPPASDDFFQELNTRSRRNHEPGDPTPKIEPAAPPVVTPPATPVVTAPPKSESAAQILPTDQAGEHQLEIVDVTSGNTTRNFTLPTVGEDSGSSTANPSHNLHYGQNITISTVKQRMAAAVKINGNPSIVQFDLMTGKNLSTVKVAEIDPNLSTSPTGLAFSNDGTILAALYESGGSALMLGYDTTTVKRTAYYVYPSGPLEGASHNVFHQSSICPLDPSPFWLVYGQGLISTQTGAHLKAADLNVPGVSAQRFLDDDQVLLISNTGSGKKLTVLKLDRTKLETALDLGTN